jgi:hypothetical protein
VHTGLAKGLAEGLAERLAERLTCVLAFESIIKLGH